MTRLFLSYAIICIAILQAQPRAVDASKSTLTVRVYKAGVLSAFGHDHQIGAPVASGQVDVDGRKVEVQVEAGALRVQDPNASAKDRGEIQATMLGPEVLDANNYKEIRFRSTSADSTGPGTWKVAGDLTLHGQTHPVSMEVHEKDGHYTGACRLAISAFGIKPVRVAGGTVRVKDEVQIEFDIQLER